jgi:hypothetical protein
VNPARLNALQIMYDALAADIGLLISTVDVTKAIQLMYATRLAKRDPELSKLEIRRDPLNSSQFFLVKKGIAVEVPDGHPSLATSAQPSTSPPPNAPSLADLGLDD